MKIRLVIASVVAILATGSAAMAIGPSWLDQPSASEIQKHQPGQLGIIKVHDNDSWNNGYYPPWSYYNRPFQFPSAGWYGNGYYGSPYWGYPNGNNYYYNKPKRLTERQVVYAVRNQHFRQITKVWFDDGVYKVRAVDYYGRRVQLLVDPYDGRVLRWSFRR